MIKRNEPFHCGKCGRSVDPLPRGERNHCPHCLFSKHMDLDKPGDRLSQCQGMMYPKSLEFKSSKGGYMILHKCEICGKEMLNKQADDDSWDDLINMTQMLP